MLRVENLGKVYRTGRETVPAVNNCSFEVKRGEFYTLLGPSGCGKSTILRCIAGLEKADQGDVWIEDLLVMSVAKHIVTPVEKRRIGMVFQSYAVWPHMDVFDNVAFPIAHGYDHLPKRQVTERVMEALRLVRLESLARRPVTFLSGGQQQRVAVARALVHEPKVLLMDEPLSNLDAKLREEMRQNLRELVERLRLTTVYVTHDQLEALSMSDRIAVMSSGRIIEEGEPWVIYNSPRNLFTAQFVGRVNALEGRVLEEGRTGDVGRVQTPVGQLTCPLPEHMNTGDEVILTVRPESLRILVQPIGNELQNVLQGKLCSVTFLGGFSECRVNVCGHELVGISSGSNNSELARAERPSQVYVHIPPEHCRIFNKSSSMAY